MYLVERIYLVYNTCMSKEKISPPANTLSLPTTADEVVTLYRQVHGDPIEKVNLLPTDEDFRQAQGDHVERINSSPSAEQIRFWMHKASSEAHGLSPRIRHAAKEAMEQAKNR